MATPPFAAHGLIAEPGAECCYWFTTEAGTDLDMVCYAQMLRSGLDPVLEVRNAAGEVVGRNDDATRLDSRLRVRTKSAGPYQLCITDHLGRGGPDFTFRLEVSKQGSGMNARERIPGRRAETVGVNVPAGGRMATVLEFRGLPRDLETAAELLLRGLPAGVEASLPPLDAGRASGVTTVPIVLRAAADVPRGSALANLRLRLGDSPERGANFTHYAPLLRVINNEVASFVRLRRLPVGVAGRVPFSIKVEPPTTPLIRGSALRLKLRVQREPGFSGAVGARMLATPSGVSGSTVRMAGDVDVADLVLEARSNAAVGRWPLVVFAQATWDGVPRSVSSEIFEVSVEEPWLTAKLPRVRSEPGESVPFEVELSRQREFEGSVQLTLTGLPRGVTSAAQTVAADAAVARFELAIDRDAAIGRHRSVVVVARVPVTADGVAEHRFGGGEIRVDSPLVSPGPGAELDASAGGSR